jgi:hypothetical protein
MMHNIGFKKKNQKLDNKAKNAELKNEENKGQIMDSMFYRIYFGNLKDYDIERFAKPEFNLTTHVYI